MKAFASLLALSLGAAYAQRIGPARIEGDYQSSQWGREIRRTLHLDRDGGVEIVTEVRGDGDDRRDRGSGRDDYARYGWTAVEAARGRAVRQTGTWVMHGDRIALRLDAVRDHTGFRTKGHEDADLVTQGDGFVLDHADDLYGRDGVEFRPVRVEEPYGGEIRLGDFPLSLVSVDFTQADGTGTLVVRASGGKILTLAGSVEKQGDDLILHVAGDAIDRLLKRDAGTLTIVLESGRVRSIRGTARTAAGRLDFTDREAHPANVSLGNI